MSLMEKPIRPYVFWRDPMTWVFVGLLVAGFVAGFLVVYWSEHRANTLGTPAPWGAPVPTDCRALREQARAFTQGAVNAGRPFGGSPEARALVALAELQLWQAEGCKP